MDIGPGDWVECIDALCEPECEWAPDDRLQVGQIYQIEDCWFDSLDGLPVVSLVDHPRTMASLMWGEKCGYSAHRFRPIYRPKADLIEGLLQPIKEDA